MLNRYGGISPEHHATLLFLRFGPACEDGEGHYEDADRISPSQLMVMTELNNHADWTSFTEQVPEDFHEVRVEPRVEPS